VWKWKKCPDVRLGVCKWYDSSKRPFAIPSLKHNTQCVLCYIMCACVKVKVTLEQATKAQSGSTGIALLFL
jgi:hypothetical protein